MLSLEGTRLFFNSSMFLMFHSSFVPLYTFGMLQQLHSKMDFIGCIESRISSRSSISVDQEGIKKVDFHYLDQVVLYSNTAKLLDLKLGLMSRSSYISFSSNHNLNPQDMTDSFWKLHYKKAEQLDI